MDSSFVWMKAHQKKEKGESSSGDPHGETKEAIMVDPHDFRRGGLESVKKKGKGG